MVFPKIPKADKRLSDTVAVEEISALLNDRMKANGTSFEQELHTLDIPDLIHVYNVCFKKKYTSQKHPLHVLRETVTPLLKGLAYVAEPPPENVFETLNGYDDVLNFFRVHCKRQCGIPDIKYDWDLFSMQDWSRVYKVLSGTLPLSGTKLAEIITSIVIRLSKHLEGKGILDTCPDWLGLCPSLAKGCAISRKIQRDVKHHLWHEHLSTSDCYICPKSENYDGSNLIDAVCDICGEPSKCVQLKYSTHCCKCTPSHDCAPGTGGTCAHCKAKEATLRTQRQFYERKLLDAETSNSGKPALSISTSNDDNMPLSKYEDTEVSDHSVEECLYCTWAEELKGRLSSDKPPFVVWKDDLCAAFINTSALQTNRPFITVISREHYQGVFDIPYRVYLALQTVVLDITNVLRDVYELSDLSIVQNTGLIAGQSVSHYAVHIIPRFKGEPFSMTSFVGLDPDTAYELFSWFKIYRKGQSRKRIEW